MDNDPHGTLLDREELAAWRGMLRAHAALVRDLDAELIRAHELPLSSYEVLLFLAGAPEGRLRMAELADGVLLSRSGLTRLVDRLEQAGLLERARCPDDARGTLATITQQGRELFSHARETHLAGVRDRFLVHFTRDELRQLGAFWERIPLEE